MTRDDLERWLLQGFTEEIEVMVDLGDGKLHPASARYDIGEHTNYEGKVVIYAEGK